MPVLFVLLVAVALAARIALCVPASSGTKLFILSGQSNMANLDENASFVPTLRALLLSPTPTPGNQSNNSRPATRLLVVKHAKGDQSIQEWYNVLFRALPRQGPMFRELADKIRAATTNATLSRVVFVWMQGERDTFRMYARAYRSSLNGLLRSVQRLVGHPIRVVVGRINDSRKDRYWKAVRRVQMAARYGGRTWPFVNTDDLNGANNSLHCTPEGYLELGRRFAVAAAALAV